MRREKSRTRGGGTEQERQMRMRRGRGERKRRKWGEARELRGQRSKMEEDPCLWLHKADSDTLKRGVAITVRL